MREEKLQVQDIKEILKLGKVRGGSLDSAIVLKGNKIISKEPLRFPDEFVRHKILDLLGDFALIGKPVLGRLVANRAGHALHTRFVAGLLESTSHWDSVTHEVQSDSVLRS